MEIRNFKFFNDNEEEDMTEFLDDSSPSWMWEEEYATNLTYDIIVSRHNGIHDFLSMFPEHSIQVVRKISGWCNDDRSIREHTSETDYPDGWGFDITRDLITIEWLRFN